MNSVNKVIILGNLGQDPEMRYTGGGSPVTEMRVATSRQWMKDGEKREETQWHTVIAWGKTAELCKEHLLKGQKVYVEGRLKTRKWKDRGGNERQTTEVVADNVLFLSRAETPAAEPQPTEV